MDELVDRMDVDELRKLVYDLADREPGVRRLLEVRAATASGEAAVAADELVAMVNRVLSVRGFVPYRESFGIAEDAESLLDELEGHLDDGAADAVRPALLRALTRLRKMPTG